jgi:beta-lactamase class A
MTNNIKRTALIIVVLGLIAIAVVSANIARDYKAEKIRWNTIRDKIVSQTKGFKGQAYIVIKDYNRNWHISIDSDIKVPAASVIKLPIMAAVFNAEKARKLSFADKVILKQSDKAGGSGTLKNQSPGKEYTVKQILELMMTISDNTATNILINIMGFDYLNNEFRKIGLKNTNISRLMMDMASRDRGIENYTTADDIAVVIDKIYRNTLVSPGVSSECIDIMKNQKTRNRIPAKLPKGTIVAHKTGLEKGVCHDAGIVFTENGDFLICVLTMHEYSNSYKSRELISNIAYIVYEYYMSSEKS